MKQYVIDQLRPDDYWKIRDYLGENGVESVMDGVYRLQLPEGMLTPTQAEHSGCQPYYFAVELTVKQVSFEFLIRSSNVLRCKCIAYATPEQRDHIIHFADKMLSSLGIRL